MGFWSGRSVLVTGGASFIGSHLVEALVRAGARVRVADDLSSGARQNLTSVITEIELITGDLRDVRVAATAVDGQEIVFHLAADHGGRGYIELHQAACSTNMALDQTLFRACLEAGVDKVVYASSGCVYPNHLQADASTDAYLVEDMVGPPYDPDGMYGLAKLAGELTLRALHREAGLASVSCRYFTAYGPRCLESHAVMAMLARAFVGEDPFVVWGTGDQVRNWTHVSDIVAGTILAGERIDDATAVNLGTMERVRVIDAARLILEYTAFRATIETRPEMPTGPMNRVADISLARRRLGWQPVVSFVEGLRRTVDEYVSANDRDVVRARLHDLLTGRPSGRRDRSVLGANVVTPVGASAPSANSAADG